MYFIKESILGKPVVDEVLRGHVESGRGRIYVFGYEQSANYNESVSVSIDWVMELRNRAEQRGENWVEDFPGLGVERTRSWFDYELEDQYIAEPH